MRLRRRGRKWQLTRLRCLLLLFILIPLVSQQTTFAQGPRPPIVTQTSSEPCVPNDPREICRLRAAVVAAQDEIEGLQKKLDAAKVAVDKLTIAADAAEKAIKANAAEREAHERTLAIAETAIKQQQELIATYQGAIKTLQDLVKMCLDRVDKLEEKLDSANKRAVWTGLIFVGLEVVRAIKN